LTPAHSHSHRAEKAARAPGIELDHSRCRDSN
jgi:hypothetical protein